MVTKVGTQAAFLDALKDLLELEYDALAAYGVAVDKIQSQKCKEKLLGFKKEHEQHIEQIGQVLERHGVKTKRDGSIKGFLTKGKVYIADLFNDKMVLQAMHSNEIDTNTAYDRLCSHKDKWLDADEVLTNAQEHERRHKAWLGRAIEAGKYVE